MDLDGCSRTIRSTETVPEAIRDTREALAQGGRRAARIDRNHAEAAPRGGSSGCSSGDSVAVHLRPHLSRNSMNLLLRGLLWTSADVRERDHDGLAVRGSGVRVPSALPT